MIFAYNSYVSQEIKAVSDKVQIPPLLRQRHDAAIGLLL